MANSDVDWEKWGKIDPYYAVYSHDEFRAGSVEQNLGYFFATGENYVDQRIARYERHFGILPRRHALDFGCGVGRLVFPLATRFDTATGIDISESMLEEARSNAIRLKIDNVGFVRSDDRLSAAPGPFDFVLSFIVLQHIPVSRGVPIIGQLLDRVAPGGGVSLHFSIWRNDSPVKTAAYWARRNVPGAQGLVNVARRLPWGEPLMQMNEYPLAQILDMAQQRGFGDALIDVERHGHVLTATFAAKRAES